MNNQDFNLMSREELRQYMLDNRDNKEAFEIYLERFRNLDSPVYPAPQSLEDMSYIQKIFQQKISQKNPDKDDK